MDNGDPNQAKNPNNNPVRWNIENARAKGRTTNENAVSNYIDPKRHHSTPIKKGLKNLTRFAYLLSALAHSERVNLPQSLWSLVYYPLLTDIQFTRKARIGVSGWR